MPARGPELAASTIARACRSGCPLCRASGSRQDRALFGRRVRFGVRPKAGKERSRIVCADRGTCLRFGVAERVQFVEGSMAALDHTVERLNRTLANEWAYRQAFTANPGLPRDPPRLPARAPAGGRADRGGVHRPRQPRRCAHCSATLGRARSLVGGVAEAVALQATRRRADQPPRLHNPTRQSSSAVKR